MKSISCDSCGKKCGDNRLYISAIILFSNNVGRNLDGEIDLCSLYCLSEWFNNNLVITSFGDKVELLTKIRD